ncbi:MAG TPA: cytochrome-c peroxidase [Polyangiaceae bacterium]
MITALSGCNSFDEPGGDPNVPRLVIPIDEREALASPVRPASISGGTLLVTADSRFAIAADPERDRVSIVDLTTSSVLGTIALEPGDEPGRSVEDAQKRVHVALRQGGSLVTIDPATATLVERRPVCKSPRGVAFDSASGLLHVACSEGKLVSLAASGGPVTRSVTLEPDLRDVMVRGSELWVTRFKSAEVLRVASAGSVSGRMRLPNMPSTLERPAPFDDPTGSSISQPVDLSAGVAWRAAPTAAGGAIVVHQQAVLDDIEITPPSAQGSAYGGGGFGCGGIVRDAVSTVAPDGTVTTTSLSGAPLPVDVAVSPDQLWLAVAHAGPADMMAPRPSLIFPSEGGISSGGIAPGSFGGTTTLSVLPMGQPASAAGDCRFNEGVSVMEPLTAVAFTPNGRLVAQSLEPPQLLTIDAVPWGNVQVIPLPGDSRLDTGHEIFHRDAGGGIACASCHPEGGEDGHTWHFTDTGARRTQPLHVGLRDTAPFHWNGDLPSVGDVMSEVFVGRMGGVRQTPERLTRLSEWLFTLPTPPAIREADDAAGARGRALFESASVGCTACHSGAKLTDNLSVAIDTAASKLQVPSLIAVGYRAPFMHTGCAATLAERFNPACGGDSHGNTSSLSPGQIDDLVAYLETL